MARALRVGKLTLAALAATLRLYRDADKARQEIPLLRLLGTSVENLKNRALRLAPQIAASGAVASAEAVASSTFLTGFQSPIHPLDTWCIAVRPQGLSVDRLAALLRTGSPPVVGRIQEDRLLLDLRSVSPRQDQELVTAVSAPRPLPSARAARGSRALVPPRDAADVDKFHKTQRERSAAAT